MPAPHIERVHALLHAAAAGPSERPPAALDGLSSVRILGLLQRLAKEYCDPSQHAYLEVGVFRGLTLLHVAFAAPALAVLGVDNFSQFDRDGTNQARVREGIAALGLGNVRLIDRGFEEAFGAPEELLEGRRLRVYFVDGPHDYRSQLMCLMLARPLLDPHAVIIVDDANNEHVRQASADFLALCPEFCLLFEGYEPGHPLQHNKRRLEAARKGWWNGVHVMIGDPSRSLRRRTPQLRADKGRFVEEHTIRQHLFADDLPFLLGWAERALALPLPTFLWKARHYWNGLQEIRDRYPWRGNTLNTNSHTLPGEVFHPDLDARAR